MLYDIEIDNKFMPSITINGVTRNLGSLEPLDFHENKVVFSSDDSAHVLRPVADLHLAGLVALESSSYEDKTVIERSEIRFSDCSTSVQMALERKFPQSSFRRLPPAFDASAGSVSGPSISPVASTSTAAALPPAAKTPGGRHVSDEGRAEILRRHNNGRGESIRQIGVALGLSKGTVQAVIDRAAIPARAEGVMTPDGRHVSDAGRAEILRRHNNGQGESQQQIGVALGLSRGTVQTVIGRAAIPARAEGVMTPRGRHVSDAGRAEILRRHNNGHGESRQQIGVALGLPKQTVKSIIHRANPPAGEAEG